MHEGSHALWVKALGGDVTGMSILLENTPYGFRFGSTQMEGPGLSDGDWSLVDLAPKFTDLALLGGYSALLETNSLSKSKYGQLALAVVATGVPDEATAVRLKELRCDYMQGDYRGPALKTEAFVERFGLNQD